GGTSPGRRTPTRIRGCGLARSAAPRRSELRRGARGSPRVRRTGARHAGRHVPVRWSSDLPRLLGHRWGSKSGRYSVGKRELARKQDSYTIEGLLGGGSALLYITR